MKKAESKKPATRRTAARSKAAAPVVEAEVEADEDADAVSGVDGPTSLVADVDFEAMARAGADAAEDKKATRVTIMQLGDASPMCDFFVLASAKTRIQTRAVANAIDERLKSSLRGPNPVAEGSAPDGLQGRGQPMHRHRQGYRAGNWILLDYGGVVFHIFLEREREYYDLEGLWSKAPVIYTSRDD